MEILAGTYSRQGMRILLCFLTSLCVAPGLAQVAGTYQGSGTSDMQPFGGGQFCSYTVSMQNVRMSVTIDSTGNITAATASAFMTETALNGCPFTTISPNTHSFSGTGTVQGSAVSIQFTGAATNQPASAGSFSG